ncbi:zinc finger BED domain-containing protein RICESLEEPER [Trifolium repens]|nr:zinc finger BED domain-containing protein RICESLEEPER [Trifolium repens]
MAEDTHTGVEQMDTDGAENSNQGGQPPIFTTQESQPPTAESQGIQPLIATENTPIATENTPTADPAALPPQPLKKRKPNASGPRKTSPAWDHFTKLPNSEVANPTAACNYCGKRYLCGTKSHGTTNMLAHSKTCPKNPHVLSNDPNQIVLTLGPNGAGGLELGAASHQFNVEFCRRALAKFVILDEQPFRSWFSTAGFYCRLLLLLSTDAFYCCLCCCLLYILTISPSTNCFLPTAACYTHSLLFGNCLLFYPNSLLLQFCKHCSFNYYASDYEIERCKKGSCNCAIVADHIEGGIVGEFDEANQ